MKLKLRSFDAVQRFLLLFLLSAVWPATGHAADCGIDADHASFTAASGRLQIPALEITDNQGQSLGFAAAELQLVADSRPGAWFEAVSITPLAAAPAWVHARYNRDTGSAELVGYLRGAGGEPVSYHHAQLALDFDTPRIQITGLDNLPPSAPAAPVYSGTENRFPLVRGGANQFLLPVEVGMQVFHLLVDTGSDALIIFEDRLDTCNRGGGIQRTGEAVSKAYAGVTRSGITATAPVRIGAYASPSMRIMLVQSPGSQDDASLTAKGADGIIGLRRSGGLNAGSATELLDAPLNLLSPRIGGIEFDLPPAGEAFLSFGTQPLLERADNRVIFRAKTISEKNGDDSLLLRKRESSPFFSDMQVPFRVKTSYGEAADPDLDILLDTGAVSRLVLDIQVAEQLGYNPVTGKWAIDENEDIELNLIGVNETLTLQPKFKVWEVSVAPYSTMGVDFEAVLGISRWQEYVVGFDFVPESAGGPDGTISLLRRLDLGDTAAEPAAAALPPPGLNSVGNDEYPSADRSGDSIAFQSDRPGGAGGVDVYLWRRGQGVMPLPGLNSAANELHPYLSDNGFFLAFESDRGGVVDIYLYDLQTLQLVNLPGLNSAVADSMPVLSGDGRYIAFVSQRSGNGDIFVYDRNQSGLLDLPGVNSDAAESAPSLTTDGRFLAYTTVRNGAEDIRLYDLQTKVSIPLSAARFGVNSGFDEQRPALNLDTLRLAFHSNRNSPELGLFDRDIFVLDALTQIPLAQNGLNSAFDDTAPRFSGDGAKLIFQSRRPGGMGGTDIYQYQLNERITSLEGMLSVARDVAFTRTAGGQFTAPVGVSGQAKKLLVATSVNALVLFRDSAAGVTDSGAAVSVAVGPLSLSGTLATANVDIGHYSAAGMRIVLAERAQVEALGISTAGSDGLLGLAHSLPASASAASPPPSPPTGDAAAGDEPPPPPPEASTASVQDVPIRVLQPTINMLELDFHDAASAGLSLNRLPATGGSDRYHSYYSDMPGTQPGGGEPSAETLVPFLAASYADSLFPAARTGAPAVNPRDMDRAGFSSLLQTRIVLDSTVAARLGYNGASWGNITRLDLSFLLFGSDALLPVVDKIPVADVLVTDLSAQPYRALLGLAYWQRYVFGIDYMSNGSNGVLFMTDARTASPAEDWQSLNRHFVPLNGLNSIADDMYGAVSANGYIAFESNRLGGSGDSDVYVWHNDLGLLDLPGLNSDRADGKPSLSGDGSLLAFESERNGSKDIFVYDLAARHLLDLPGLDTAGQEEHPVLSADGTLLAYSTRQGGNADIRFYRLDTQQAGRNYAGWLNTGGDENFPSLSRDGSLLAFTGVNRADSMGASQDVFLYNLQKGRLDDLPRLNTAFHDGTPALSPDGNFLAFFSNRYDPGLEYIGSDIMLLELASGELLSLPGLDSPYEDTSPALSDNAEFIVFHSKRPGGTGGYDLYLYQRDLDDKTRYTVSHAYREDGYVADNNGKRLAGVSVQATDADGNLLGSAVTDADGAFAIDINVGTVLPIRYSAAQGDVVVDEVGDDTYIPDFEAGNLKFTQVWVEDTLQSGMPSKIWFDVETETPKYNTFVKIYLVKLPTGSVDDLNTADFTPDYTLTALSIDELGTGNSATVTHTQGQDIVTEVSYLSDNKAHVEHSFVVPPEVADGTYAAVFSIGRFDYHPEDDALQSEDPADRRDNFLAAPASVIVGQPDKPNLRILSAMLDSNSFELPAQRPSEDSVPSLAELNLNLEVESMAQDTELPVNLVFALNIDGQPYPLSFAASEGTRPVKRSVKTYPVTCRDETRDGWPAGERCAALFRQEQQGYTYKLYIDAAAYDALAAKTADTPVNLVIQLDPAGTVNEWENNTADNRKVMPVMFLAPRTAKRLTRSGGVPDTSGWPLVNDYSTYSGGQQPLINFTGGDNYGNNDFAAGYNFHAKLTYATSSIDDVTYPYAAGFDGTGNEAYVKIFGHQIDMLTVDAAADVNGDKLLCTWFGYDVNILEGYKTYQAYYHVENIDPKGVDCQPNPSVQPEEAPQSIELWSSQDPFGNEKYTLSKSKDYEKTFTVGPIPITVAAGASGDMGIRGNATLDTTNTVQLVVGPYLELKGYAEGGVGIFGITAGIGIELVFLRVELPFTTKLRMLPSVPVAALSFEAPLVISTLDGEVYLFAKTWWDKYTFTIVSWNGFQWEYALIDPVLKIWMKDNQFATIVDGLPTTESSSAIDFAWSSGTNIGTKVWQGNFDFDVGTYIFETTADGFMQTELDGATLFATGTTDSAGDHDGSPKNFSGWPWRDTDALSGVDVKGSLAFDGVDDYVDLVDFYFELAKQNFTLEAWIKVPAGTTDVAIISSNDDDTAWERGEKCFYLDFEGVVSFVGWGNDYIGGITPVNDGKWHHVAVTWDYGNGTGKIYVDGALDTEFSHYRANNGNNSGNTLKIGRPNYGEAPKYFNGQIDEVRIWNVARGAAQISSTWNSQLNGTENGLVAYYRFDDPGTTVLSNVEITANDTEKTIDVEYQNLAGDANVSLSWSKPGDFMVSYYNGTSFTDAAPALTRQEDAIDHDWGAGSPFASDDTGSFSARWRGAFSFDTQAHEFISGPDITDYTFIISSDDNNVRLYIDNSQVTLTQVAGTNRYYGNVTIDPELAYHPVVVEYTHESGDALMKLDVLPTESWIEERYSKNSSTGEWELLSEIPYLSVPTGSVGQTAGTKLHRYSSMRYFDQAGVYDFIAHAEDGIKLYVDGKEYFGHWSLGGIAAYITPVTLDTAGYHQIVLEHYVNVSDSDISPPNEFKDFAHYGRTLALEWPLHQDDTFTSIFYGSIDDMQQDNLWDADDYNGIEARVIRPSDLLHTVFCGATSTSLACNWPDGYTPADTFLDTNNREDPDNFGARFLGDFNFEEGIYLFTVTADDGVRVWLDNAVLVDAWDADSVSDTWTDFSDQQAIAASTSYQEAVAMTSSVPHNMRIEYWEKTGSAYISTDWYKIEQDTFYARYFDNVDFSGTPMDDGSTTAAINYSGGNSVRWVGVFEFEETEYTFDVATDGSVQLYLDGKAIIDTAIAGNDDSVTVAVEEGLHSVKVEYAAGSYIDVAWAGKSEIAGNALSLDGVDDYVELPAILNPATAGAFTAETWFRPDSLAVLPQMLVQQADGGGTGRTWLGIGEANKLYTFIGGSGLSGTTTLQAGNWYHAAMVYDGAVVSLYLDGELENSRTLTPESSDGNLLLGIHKGLEFGEFAGTLDEVRIWNTARSQAEIQAWMKSTLNGNEAGLLAYYPFEQDTATTITDVKGAYHGTLNGGPLPVASDALLTELPPPGSALSFDGTDDYVYVANNGALDLTQGSIEFWMQPQWSAGTPAYNPAVIAGRDTDGTNFSIHIKKELSGVDLWNGSTVQTLPYSFVSGTWYHVALVAGSGSHEVFVNGQSIGSRAYGFSGTAGKPLHIGTPTGSGVFFIGQIDEVRIWDTLRSQSEIQAYMNRTLEGNESDLIAYYNFDAVPGSDTTTLTDRAGSHHGALNGGPVWVASGATLSKPVAPGNALSFDGADDYVALGNILPNAYTKEAWVKRSPGSRNNNIISGDGTNKHAFWAPGYQGFKLAAGHNDAWFQVQDSEALAEDTWYHVAVTYDGSSEMKLYKNGVLVDSATGVSPLGGGIAANIGKYDTGNYWGGEIDEVRIWSTARSQAEIQADMYGTVSPFTTGLTAYYRFDQDRGAELIDLTGNDFDGTLNGNPGWMVSGAME